MRFKRITQTNWKKNDAQNDCEKRVYGSFPYTFINQNEYNNESEWVLLMNIVKSACSNNNYVNICIYVSNAIILYAYLLNFLCFMID